MMFILVSVLLLTRANDSFGAISLAPRNTRSKFGENVLLECTLDSGDQGAWDEVIDGTATGIFLGSVVAYRDPKYNNFAQTGVLPEYNLMINAAAIEDEGNYQCRVTGVGGDSRSANVNIEAEATLETVQCSSPCIVEDSGITVTETTSCECSCTAVGGYPKTLDLNWNIGTAGELTITNVTNNPPGSFDFTRSVTISPTRVDSSLVCSLQGYALFSDVESTVDITVQYKPECTLAISGCPAATLTCTCEAVPTVTEYSFTQNGTNIDDTSGCTTNVAVELDTKTEYTCFATNDVGIGTPSVEILECSTTTPVTETNTTRRQNDTEDPSSVGLIVGVIVGWVLATVLAIVLIVTFHYRRKTVTEYSKENKQKSILTTNESAGVDNTAYMDLTDRAKTEGGRDLPGEIPETNVKFSSGLPSRGFMVYHKVNIIRNSGHEKAVSKSLSDTVTISLLKLWYSEIKGILNLPKQHNIVEVLGWCNAVPSFLLTECVTGGNLSQHLSDNYSPHKLHQYGNTKRKKFEVPEKGNPESLPQFALDVSRGLRFLLVNKFIHPGLRAEKVLVDSAGRCKLYDILSMERAKKIISGRWRESVPYQWMPPEYLILGTVSAAGDIWSFGVLLWEIFSYGSKPYPGESRDTVENSLRRADRLPMPQNCPGAIWQLMVQCWEQSPEMRPRLDEITPKLTTMCNANKEYEEIPNQRPLV